jgi:hypothetical protein
LADTLGTTWHRPLLLQKVLPLVLGLGALPAVVLAWYHGERGRQVVNPIETAVLTALVPLEIFVVGLFVVRAGSP